MRGSELVSHKQSAVEAAHTESLSAVALKELNKALVDLAREHHLDDVHCLLVGDAHSVLEYTLLADGVEHRVDFGASAVNQHYADSDELHERQIAHDRRLELLIYHSVAAVLDNNRFSDKFFDIGHRLNKNLCPLCIIHIFHSEYLFMCGNLR